MSLFITGPAGSGKTTELLRRARESAVQHRLLITSAAPSSLASLRTRCAFGNFEVMALEQLALQLLGRGEIIEDADAALLFEEAAEPLLSLEWSEFVEAQIDPEVPGLRAPRRFLDAAFRLFCKLREAGIGPKDFLETALRGATSFYGKPPNFAHPGLLAYTKDAYHDSLNADAAELQRQYRREVDLAKILAKLYTSYLERLIKQGCLTARDAIYEAVSLVKANPGGAAAFRANYPAAFVDDAQELTLMELLLLQALYGENLENVTLAADADSALTTFQGARPDRVLGLARERIACEFNRSPFAIDVACRRLAGAPPSNAISTEPEVALTLFRATTKKAEARFVAERVWQMLEAGAQPKEIAIVFRSVRTIGMYRDALLAAGIPLEISGDLNIFEEPDALDALALLWLVHDPFRHDYLLRVLSGRALALSDATLARLCADAQDGQALLFEELAADESDVRSGRWDPKRDFRLGWNVMRGERDESLGPVARERLQHLRARVASWIEALKTLELPDFAALVWKEGLARAGGAGSARSLYQQSVLQRLHARVAAFARSRPEASLAEFLDYAQARGSSDLECCESTGEADAMQVLDLQSVRGLEFDHVVLPNVRAGSFPRWYAPDAFLYSPSLGMIAKENVGDAKATRTAKFTYYMFAGKAREAYNREERRGFIYALRRAKKTAVVTSHERATRGIAAPEFLFELQAARLPGVVDLSDRWSPSESHLHAG